MTKKTVFVGNTGFSILHFRMPLIRFLMSEGWSVAAVANYELDFSERISREGIRPIHIPIDHKGKRPISDLHLVWQQDGNLRHRVNTSGGDWSQDEILTDAFETTFGAADLLQNPGGSICLFFDAARVSVDPGTVGLYWRCWTEGGWSPASDRYAHSEAPSGKSPHAVAFASDGSIKVVHSAGRAPVRA